MLCKNVLDDGEKEILSIFIIRKFYDDTVGERESERADRDSRDKEPLWCNKILHINTTRGKHKYIKIQKYQCVHGGGLQNDFIFLSDFKN